MDNISHVLTIKTRKGYKTQHRKINVKQMLHSPNICRPIVPLKLTLAMLTDKGPSGSQKKPPQNVARYHTGSSLVQRLFYCMNQNLPKVTLT